MKRVLKDHLFLVILSIVIGGDLLMWYLGVPPTVWVEFTYSFVLVTLVVLEFVMPRNAAWNYVTKVDIKYRELSVDVFFLILETLVLSAATYTFATWVADHVRSATSSTRTISSWVHSRGTA